MTSDRWTICHSSKRPDESIVTLFKIMEFTTVIIAAVVILCIILYSRRRNKVQLPPGPPGWPLVGNALDLPIANLHLHLQKLGREYGSVFMINLMGLNCVVLNDAEAIREAFLAPQYATLFAGRPRTFYSTYVLLDSDIVLQQYSDRWARQKKITFKAVRAYGEGYANLERVVIEELCHVKAMLKSRDGSSLNLEDVLTPSLANILTILLVGERFDYHSDEMKHMYDHMWYSNQLMEPIAALVTGMFPILRFLPFGWGRSFRMNMACADKITHNFFAQQKLTYDPQRRRGIVDELLATQQDNEELTDQNIVSIILDILGAGITTTQSVLRSFFLTILQKPDIAETITKEINKVIGTCQPCLKHREFMPYTEAVILELLRLCAPAPLSIFHSTTTDVVFRGYSLPKDTMVIPNLYAAHLNDTVFPEPLEFKPKRWLDDNGGLLDANHLKRKNLLAFGVGKRLCLGESFAKSRIFLYVTTLLQSFNFAPGDGTLPKLDPREFCSGVVMSPAPYQVLLSDRNSQTHKI